MSSVRRWWRRKAALLLLPHRVVRVGGSEPRRRRHLDLVLFEESRGVETSLLTWMAMDKFGLHDKLLKNESKSESDHQHEMIRIPMIFAIAVLLANFVNLVED